MKEKLSILFCPSHYIYDDGQRGSELSWAYQICDRLSLHISKCTVVTGFKNISKKKKYTIVELQRDKKNVDLGIVNTIFFNFLYSLYGIKMVRTGKFDIVHHILPFAFDRTFNFAFFYPAKVKKIVGPIQSPLPIFPDNIHDTRKKPVAHSVALFNKLIYTIAGPLTRYLSTKTLEKADVIIVINQRTRKMLLDRGIAKRKIQIIPPGVDSSRFSKKAKKRKSNMVTILAVGALIERKGFDVLLKAITRVIKSKKNFHLYILGDGPQRSSLQKIINDYKLNEYVSLEGNIAHNQIEKYYQRADIFVCASRAEGFATVSLEAMASGLCVVSTKVGGFLDAIDDKKNGFLVSIDNDRVLANQLLILLKNPELIRKTGLAAREKTMKYYDWNYIISKYQQLYHGD